MTHEFETYKQSVPMEKIAPNGELGADWVDKGSNSAVYKRGRFAVKVCLSLPNEYLEGPAHSRKNLEVETQQLIEDENAAAAQLRHYFPYLVPSHASLGRANVPGDIALKMLGSSYIKLRADKIYDDVPLAIIQQPFVDVYTPPNEEVHNFVIGKGDFNHIIPPDPDTYARMNALLLGGTEDIAPGELNPQDVFEVQKARSLLYYMEKIHHDDSYRQAMGGFVNDVARFTHETGEMIDVFAVRPNGFFVCEEDSREWKPVFYEMRLPPWIGHSKDLNQLRRQFIENPYCDSVDALAVAKMAFLTSYIRSFNVLAAECGLRVPFSIFSPNMKADEPPDCHLGSEGWRAVYERIHETMLEFDKKSLNPSSAREVYVSSWRST